MNTRSFIHLWLATALCAAASGAWATDKVRAKRVSQSAGSTLIVGKGPSYARHPEAMALADDIAKRHQLDRKWVRRTISHARQVPQIMKMVVPPPVTSPRNWQQYRERVLDPERVRAGVAFWRTHRAVLDRATAAYGVPPEIIVGIIGVETFYGRHTGNYRVLDTLATLAFDFPEEHPRAQAREAFFRTELGEFLSLQRKAGLDPRKPRGSYAGAMGIPQFMPSSWARYAVDFDGDGRIDLAGDPVDAIGSVANYFKAFNWRPGMPTHYAVDFDYSRLDLDALLAPDIRPTFTVEAFTERGAMLDSRGQLHRGPLALVALSNGEYSPSYVAGTENFFVITRYNWSSYYAMAVIELGRAVAAALPPAEFQASTTLSKIGCSASTHRSTSDAATCR